MVSQRQYRHFQTSLFAASKTYIHKLSFICLCFHESVPNYFKSDFQTSLMVGQWLNILEEQGKGVIPQLVPMLQTPGTPLLFKCLGNLYFRGSRTSKCCLQHPERDILLHLCFLSKVLEATSSLL